MRQKFLLFGLKNAFFILVLVFFARGARGAPVDSIMAKAIAANFYSRNYRVNGVSLNLVYTEKSLEGEVEYYIYNVIPCKGFVIVSAEDAGYPILGYSSEGYYNSKTISPDFAFWMQRYKKQIGYMRINNIKATTDIENEWSAYRTNLPVKSSRKVTGSVNPLVKTTWAQAPYFNASCPGNCVAGCVATAMGQIMKYWAFPPYGIGSNSYYDDPYGNVYANFSIPYDWAEMPDNVTKDNAQVAALMYNCGVSVNMAYTANSSGAYMIIGDNPVCAENAFVQYFGYYGPSVQGLYRADYPSSSWTALLINELNNNRPFLYAGSGDSGSHAWVCDGYNTNGDFHMNWGWGGYEDGYYNPDDLNPDKIPLGSNEEALIGIEPNAAVVDFSSTVNVYPTLNNGSFYVQLQNASLIENNYAFSVYDMLGRKMYTTTLVQLASEVTLNVPHGMYFYKAFDALGKSVANGKLMIK